MLYSIKAELKPLLLLYWALNSKGSAVICITSHCPISSDHISLVVSIIKYQIYQDIVLLLKISTYINISNKISEFNVKIH